MVALEHAHGQGPRRLHLLHGRARLRQGVRQLRQPRPRRARRQVHPRHPLARRRDAGHARTRASATSTRPAPSSSRSSTWWSSAWGCRCPQSVREMAATAGPGPQRVRLRPDRPAGPPGHLPARPLRGRRVPGAQGHPRVGGPGLGGRRLRHGPAGPGPRHHDPAARVPLGARRHRRAARGWASSSATAATTSLRSSTWSRWPRARPRMPNVCHAESQHLHLLGHQPAAHQGHDQGAPAQPPGGGLLLAAHARDPLPGDAARERAEPVPVRHDQHPRPVLLGAQGRPGGRHRQGRRPHVHGRRPGAASQGPADRPTAGDGLGARSSAAGWPA